MKNRKILTLSGTKISNRAGSGLSVGSARKNLTNSRGFTLVELLVVIAIIALLMAILMPALARVKKQAKVVVCQSNLKQWGAIFSMYTGDQHGYFHKGWAGVPVKHWMVVLRPYYSNEQKLRFCPAATKPRSEGGQGPTSAWGVFVGGWGGEGMDQEGNEGDESGSYGINSWVCNPPEGQEPFPTPGKYWRTADVKNSADVPLFLDAWWFDGWAEPRNSPLQFEDSYISGNSLEAMGDFCVNRHDGLIDGLFLDFSVRKIGLKELWTLKWHRTFDTCELWTLCGGVEPDDWPEWMQDFKDY
jgi:prepilin-type N-terminal cleavage/methylation domain-containing protein